VIDQEIEQFQQDLLTSISQMRANQRARVSQPEPTLAAIARAKLSLSQSAFSKLLGVSVRTLQEWEQGRRNPSGAAKTLLSLAVQNPTALTLYINTTHNLS
jgi:putative transcriptional regulator